MHTTPAFFLSLHNIGGAIMYNLLISTQANTIEGLLSVAKDTFLTDHRHVMAYQLGSIGWVNCRGMHRVSCLGPRMADKLALL